jgi:Ras-related protein Rab-2A
MSHSYQFKFIIIGDAAVGKSCIMLQFIDKGFRPEHDLTIGVEFGSKIIECKDVKVKLQIWDTAGSESFKSITRAYYRSAAGALLVYDITRRESFNHVIEWLDEARTHGNPSMAVTLIGNKSDLETQRVISTDEGERFARENGLEFLETSALKGDNIQLAFISTSTQILNKINDRTIDLSSQNVGVVVKNPQIKKNINQGGCCKS